MPKARSSGEVSAMKGIPYVNFNGNCEEAVRFYHSILGGELELLRFKDIPEGGGMRPGGTWNDKIMHGSIKFEGGNYLYFSDSWEGNPVTVGSNVTVHLEVDSEKDVHTFVEKLGAGGNIQMPAAKVFWGSVYGSVVDRYGVSWGIEYQL